MIAYCVERTCPLRPDCRRSTERARRSSTCIRGELEPSLEYCPHYLPKGDLIALGGTAR